MIFNKITIIGLGLIGGSLASALKISGEVEEIVGIEKNQKTIQFALDNNIIDFGFSNIDDSIGDSDVIVIATYVDKIAEIARELSKLVSKKTVITDVGSVKGSIINKINNFELTDFRFVGSHPIAGKENSGIKYSDRNLFTDKICIITPTLNTDSNAIEITEHLWEIVGCNVIKLDPKLHDFIFSNVSHLPHVVAYSLINTVATADSDLNLFNYAGGGLNDFTRIAGSSPEMWTTIFLNNREALLESIKLFKDKLIEIEKAIESEKEEELIKILKHSQSLKDSF